MPADPLISLIIPAWNEAELLPRLLQSVEVARARFDGGSGRVEVIVADNGSGLGTELQVDAILFAYDLDQLRVSAIGDHFTLIHDGDVMGQFLGLFHVMGGV